MYNMVDSGSPQVKLHILKLLVNLSANEDMVPSLLAAEVSGSICYRFMQIYALQRLNGRLFSRRTALSVGSICDIYQGLCPVCMLLAWCIPSTLLFKAPRRLIYLLDPSTNEEILLRVVTLLANLTSFAKELKLDPTIDLPAEDKAASPDTMWVECGTLTDNMETHPLLHKAVTVRLVQVDCMIFISSY